MKDPTVSRGPLRRGSYMISMRKALFCFFLLTPSLISQPQARPARTFGTHCSICHGGNAGGTDRAPNILPFVTSHSDAELTALVRSGRLDKGMPDFDFTDSEMKVLIGYLRGLSSGAASAAAGPARGGRGGPAGRTPPHSNFRMAARWTAHPEV